MRPTRVAVVAVGALVAFVAARRRRRRRRVRVEEVSSGSPPIGSVGTSTAGFAKPNDPE